MNRPLFFIKDKVRFLIFLLLCGLVSLLTSSCLSEEPKPEDDSFFTGRSEMFNLTGSDPKIFGTITLRERKDRTTLVRIEIRGLEKGNTYRAGIFLNSILDEGDEFVQLENLAGGESGKNTHVKVSVLGEKLGYNDLTHLNGHVRIIDPMGMVIATADIGRNGLTGKVEKYEIATQDGEVKINVTFAERRNGNTLASVELVKGQEGVNYIPVLYSNSAIQNGSEIHKLPVLAIGNTFNRMNFNAADRVGDFESFIKADCHIRIFKNEERVDNVIAKADVFGNALTGNYKKVAIEAIGNSGITGQAYLFERNSGFILVEVKLEGTDADKLYPAGLYQDQNAVESLLVFLNYVHGSTGVSLTDVRNSDDYGRLTYRNISDKKGLEIKIKSGQDSETILALGKIH
jgi:hypothetical protein